MTDDLSFSLAHQSLMITSGYSVHPSELVAGSFLDAPIKNVRFAPTRLGSAGQKHSVCNWLYL